MCYNDIFTLSFVFQVAKTAASLDIELFRRNKPVGVASYNAADVSFHSL